MAIKKEKKEEGEEKDKVEEEGGGGEKNGISLQEYRERKGMESSALKGNQKPSGHWEEEGSTLTGEAFLIIP